MAPGISPARILFAEMSCIAFEARCLLEERRHCEDPERRHDLLVRHVELQGLWHDLFVRHSEACLETARRF